MVESDEKGSSGYATGGGGVVLEHRYAGSALACLLLGSPIDGLGDEFAVVGVALQQDAESPVDDLVITGKSGSDSRRIYVACRRRPTLTAPRSSTRDGQTVNPTVKLFADFVRAALRDEADLASGRLRLGLAVAGPYGSASELAELTEIARMQSSRAAFDDAVDAPRKRRKIVRDRRDHIDDLVVAALEHLGLTGAGHDAQALTFRLLQSLYVIQTQLEGSTASGRTSVKAQLLHLTGDATAADNLFRRLNEIAQDGAVNTAKITQAILRRELQGFGPLGAAPAFEAARTQVALLRDQLRQATALSLRVSASEAPVTLDRAELHLKMRTAITSLAPGTVLLVSGAPDVGKSAASLSVVDELESAGAAVMAMSLRDLPSQALELRGVLGLPVEQVFSSAPSAPLSVLLLDGAEVVQEEADGVFRALVAAACASGISVVAVTRDDAIAAVQSALRAAGIEKAEPLIVEPLNDKDLSAVLERIPTLARFGHDPRSAWLLRRLGLVDLLLQAAIHAGDLPTTLSSEADVFATVWTGLVKNGGRTKDGTTPDEREAALVELARQLFSGKAATLSHARALPSLRSDGVLAPLDRQSAWQAAPARFSSDVLRDFGCARVLLQDGLPLLESSGAPRWAIRAVGLFAQARLSEAARNTDAALAREWAHLYDQFNALAALHGGRWVEVLWEALLSPSWADRAIAAINDWLTSNPGGVSVAISCATKRFSGDVHLKASAAHPLVRWLVRAGWALDPHRKLSNDEATKFVLSWLSSVAALEYYNQEIARYRSLRTEIRDALLLKPRTRWEEWEIEALALLGCDSSAETDAVLTGLADLHSYQLAAVVESPVAPTLLAGTNPQLLLTLTRAYYLERPPKRGQQRTGVLDHGIRDHSRRSWNWSAPNASATMGPFSILLRHKFIDTLKLIDDLLLHAAEHRMANRTARRQHDETQHPSPTGVEMDLLSLGARTYVGDAEVWSWYRGTSTGPHPCTSALMALEVAMDQIVTDGGPVERVASVVLKDASTLASVGMVYGFLVRHQSPAGAELDGFLSDPHVWEFDSARATGEAVTYIRREEHSDVVSPERRRMRPNDVAAELVISVLYPPDVSGQERLKKLSRLLIERTGGSTESILPQQWAAHLDPEAYTISLRGSQAQWTVTFPDSVQATLAALRAHVDDASEMYRLLNRYMIRNVLPYRVALAVTPPLVELASDLVSTRALLQSEEVEGRQELSSAVAGLAAAIVTTAVGGQPVDADAVSWALPVLLSAATQPYDDEYASEVMLDPWAADRQAALALPLLLPLDGQTRQTLGVDTEKVARAITACIVSPFYEVQGMALATLATLGGHPCHLDSAGRCWHEAVAHALEAAARHLTLGAWDEQGRREIVPVSGDIAAAIGSTSAESLVLPRVAPATGLALQVARWGACVSERVEPLADALLAAYARAATTWAEENYDFRVEPHASFAAQLLEASLVSGPSLLTDLLRSLASSPAAMGKLLEAATMAATYELRFVPLLTQAWPEIMDVSFAAIDAHTKASEYHDREELIRHLVPDPVFSVQPQDYDERLEAAKGNWLPLVALERHLQGWVEAATYVRGSIDTLIGYLRTCSLEDQVNVGLPHVRLLLVGEDGKARGSGFLVEEWFTSLREGANLSGARLADYRVCIDALASSDYRGGLKLQTLEERLSADE